MNKTYSSYIKLFFFILTQFCLFKKREINHIIHTVKGGVLKEHFWNILFNIAYTINVACKRKQKAKYPKIDRSLKYFQTSLPISWPRVNFCRVCWVAHVSHSGSGSSQVWQKYAALTWTFSKEHGTHVISFKLDSSLQENLKTC